MLGPLAGKPGLLRFAVWAVLGLEVVAEVANMPIGLAGATSESSELGPWGWNTAAQHFAASAAAGSADPRSTCLGAGIPSLVWLGGERAEVMAVGASAALVVSASDALRMGGHCSPIAPGSPLVSMENVGMGKVPDCQLASASVAAGRVAVTTQSGLTAVRLQAGRWAVVMTPNASPMRLNGVRATTIISVRGGLLLCSILESSGLAAFLSFPLEFSAPHLVATGALVSETFRFTGAPIQGASMSTIAGAAGPSIILHFPAQSPACFHTIVFGADCRVTRTCTVALAPPGTGGASSHARITDLRPCAGSHAQATLIARVAAADGSQHHVLSATVPAAAVASPPESRRAEVLAERTAAAKSAAAAPSPQAAAPAPVSAAAPPAVVAREASSPAVAAGSPRGGLLRPRDLATKSAVARPAESPAQPAQSQGAHDLPERKGAGSSPVHPSTELPESIQEDADGRLESQRPATSSAPLPAASASAAAQAAAGAGDADYARSVADAIATRLRPAMAGIVREAAAETASAASSAMSEAADELTTRVATAAAPALQAAFIATFQRELAPAMGKAIAEMTRQQAAAMKAASDAQVAASERLLAAFEARLAAAGKDLRAASEVASKSAQRALRAAEQATVAADGARTATAKAAEAASAVRSAADRCAASAASTASGLASLEHAAESAARAASRANDAADAISAKISDAMELMGPSENAGSVASGPAEDSYAAPSTIAASAPLASSLPVVEAGPSFVEDPAASMSASAVRPNGHSRSHSVPPPAEASLMSATLQSYADGTATLNSVVESALELQDAAAVVWMCAELEAMGDSSERAVAAMSPVSALCLFQQLASSGSEHLPLRFRWLAPTGPRLRAAKDDETVHEHLPSIAADAISELRPVFSSAPAAPGLDAATKADIRAVRDFLLTFT